MIYHYCYRIDYVIREDLQTVKVAEGKLISLISMNCQ